MKCSATAQVSSMFTPFSIVMASTPPWEAGTICPARAARATSGLVSCPWLEARVVFKKTPVKAHVKPQNRFGIDLVLSQPANCSHTPSYKRSEALSRAVETHERQSPRCMSTGVCKSTGFIRCRSMQPAHKGIFRAQTICLVVVVIIK